MGITVFIILAITIGLFGLPLGIKGKKNLLTVLSGLLLVFGVSAVVILSLLTKNM